MWNICEATNQRSDMRSRLTGSQPQCTSHYYSCNPEVGLWAGRVERTAPKRCGLSSNLLRRGKRTGSPHRLRHLLQPLRSKPKQQTRTASMSKIGCRDCRKHKSRVARAETPVSMWPKRAKSTSKTRSLIPHFHVNLVRQGPGSSDTQPSAQLESTALVPWPGKDALYSTARGR